MISMLNCRLRSFLLLGSTQVETLIFCCLCEGKGECARRRYGDEVRRADRVQRGL